MYSFRKPTSITIPSRELRFKRLEASDIEIMRPYLKLSSTRSCDFTIGGLFMWKDLFNYEYCICEDTLFIRSLSEDGSGRNAFLMPVGHLSLYEAIDILKNYCAEHDEALLFTAVPDDRLDDFIMRAPSKVSELDGWADYIYNADTLATLSGKAYNKKRNHVNRFISDNPDYRLEDMSESNLKEAAEFLASLGIESAKADENMAYFEMGCTSVALEQYTDYGFTGAILRDNSGKIVAFTFGEISGDTLVLHVEKMEHLVPGAGEAINKMFAERMTLLHPEIKYINREDDAADPGLRRAKESYHPEFLLRKYNVEF